MAKEPKAGKKPIEQYDHKDKKRVNNPPVGLVTPELDREKGVKAYAYDPHLDMQLQWSGKAEHISFLVSFYPEARHTLFDHVDMQEELQNIFKRKVDLITRNAVEKSRNYIRRKAILESMEPYYVQE